jgi:NAD(P)-dependent dehydrogenase (short-subunit alcohol dehydrogenase family)
MSNAFGATSTTDQVLEGVNLSGKRLLVTGVSAGIGVETARALASHGAEVVGAARDLSKAQNATQQVRALAALGGSLSVIQLDLASLESVRRCADGLLAAGKRTSRSKARLSVERSILLVAMAKKTRCSTRRDRRTSSR